MKTIKCWDCIDTFNDKGELHSFNDKPANDYYNGDKYWYKNGKRHRIDGPAITCNGNKWYYKEGKRHRLDGPAVELADGGKTWYYEDKEINCFSTEEFLKIINLKTFW